jgi:predicted peptidase
MIASRTKCATLKGAVLVGSAMTLFGLLGCRSSGEWTRAEGQQAQSFERKVTRSFSGKFLLYLPKDFGKEKKKWPLMMFLHGSGERGDDLEKVKVHGPPKLVAQGKEFPFIIISPQCPEGTRWASQVEMLNALLDEAMAKLPVDEERIYLTGLSMGGQGVWHFAYQYPQRFAAIAPVCGWGVRDVMCVFKNMPAWIFHGAKDDVVPVAESERLYEGLKKCGNDVKYTVYPDANHDSWTETYNNPELYTWLLQHKRTQQATP